MPSPFDISGRVVAVTGATGVLAGSLARHLAAQGALVALLGRDPAKLDAALAAFPPGQAAAFACDVLDRPSLERARDTLAARFGRLDALVNGAGGNLPGAIVPPDGSFFDLDPAQWQSVLNLNLGGTLLPTLVLGALFEKPRRGSILNFSSMAAGPAITRVLGYSNAKAGVDNLTRWLAVEFARKIGPDVRVNALAPGFFISAQNRALLTNPDGSLSERGSQVVAKTPAGRFGEPPEINGAAHFLISDAARFVTGVVLPVDGGFSAFSGV